MIDRVHGGSIERHPKNIPYKMGKIIDFSANINPLGLLPKARRIITRNIAGLIHYPEPDSRSLKKALGDFHGINRNNLVVGNGSIELIHLIPKALKSGKILIITPTFSEYELAGMVNGAKIMFFKTEERDNFRIGLDELGKYLSWAELIFLCNPNNPTGSCISAGDMSVLVKLCFRYQTILVVDEAFMDFVEKHDANSLMGAAAGKRGIIVIRSLTKFFAMPGLRIGYAIGSRDFVRKISNLQYPWNVNSLAQVAGEEVLKNSDYMETSRRYVSKERGRLFNSLRDIKELKIFPSSSNFILCKLEKSAIKDARLLNKRLIKEGLIVRDCGNFRGLDKKFFRVAVKTRDENRRLIMGLKKVL